ncbi:hypothetical protein JHK85_004342 [Glycine max]|nr:hypothetical protein JHK85_004342 [Glycine max]
MLLVSQIKPAVYRWRSQIVENAEVLLDVPLIIQRMESQIMPPVIPFPPPSLHPLCLSQLALVSYACAMLPPTTTPPPSPLTSPPSPSSPSDDEGHRNDQNHGHHQTSQEENCCRWAKEMDNQCVCEFLLLLPPFLTRPLHQYSISIGESCNATYSCGGPI